MNVTREELSASLQVIKAVADTIRELKEIPSGHLYAQLMTSGMTLNQYQQIISMLKRTGLVSESNNLLTWTGN